MNVVMQDSTGATAVRSYSNKCIIGEDGKKSETFTPRGVDAVEPVGANLTIDGISQFEGLVNEGKTLTISGTGTSAVWDNGAAETIEINTSYTPYDSDDNNFLMITIGGTLPNDGDYTVTIGDVVIGDQVTVLQLDDELLTSAPAITDAGSVACAAAPPVEYPRPGATSEYAIYGTDKSLIAIKNAAGSDDLSVEYSIYKIARAYTSLTALDADHKSGTEISKTAAKMFANGAATVSVMNCWDGDSKEYALCLTELETQNYSYDIMVPTVDVDDDNFVLCAAHAITYSKVIIAPKIGTTTVVRASWALDTLDEGQYGICYDDSTYSVGELSGAAAAVIGQKKPWIPPEWGQVSGINPAGYSKDDLNTIEGTSATMGGNTVIQVGTSTVLSSARSLKAGSFIDIPRTKLYLKNAVIDAWVSAKLRIAGAGDKIPYTQGGITRIESIIRKPLKNAQKAGALREDSYDSLGVLQPGFVIKMPLMENISAAYISARQLPDVEITAYLSGAISTINPLYFTISLGEV